MNYPLTRRFLAVLLPLFLLSGASRTESSPATSAPTPTLEQRMAYTEAERSNSDPTPTGIAPSASPAHTAWMMVSAALVLFMTLPGLILFYGGLMRQKNVLSMAALCLGITALIAVIWWACGYSLVFGKSFAAEGATPLARALSPFLGGTEFFFSTMWEPPRIPIMPSGFRRMSSASFSSPSPSSRQS